MKPTDDFFRFVNQKWIDENPIPPDESRWGSFYVLRVDVERQLKKIFETINAKPDGSVAGRSRKVRDFYRTGMDSAKRNEQGDTPLTELFSLVDGERIPMNFRARLGYCIEMALTHGGRRRRMPTQSKAMSSRSILTRQASGCLTAIIT